MATFVEYSDFSEMKTWGSGAKLTPIGYLTENPERVLRGLMPNFHVVDYLGISIPSRSQYDNQNAGLRLSSVASGIGLVGTVEMLNQSELFLDCRHEPYSAEQRRDILEKMKSGINLCKMHSGPLNHTKAEKYALIFDVLGDPMSVDELVKFSTPEGYYAPIPNGGFYSLTVY